MKLSIDRITVAFLVGAVFTLASACNFLNSNDAKEPSRSEKTTFSNSWIMFELPPSWECITSQDCIECGSKNQSEKDGIKLILSAKFFSTGDLSLVSHFKAIMEPIQKSYNETKQIIGSDGKIIQSNVVHSNSILLPKSAVPPAGQEWIDVLQYQSERPGFYTRMMATVVPSLLCAVKIIYLKDKVSEYQPLIDTITNSMRVYPPAKADH